MYAVRSSSLSDVLPGRSRFRADMFIPCFGSTVLSRIGLYNYECSKSTTMSCYDVPSRLLYQKNSLQL